MLCLLLGRLLLSLGIKVRIFKAHLASLYAKWNKASAKLTNKSPRHTAVELKRSWATKCVTSLIWYWINIKFSLPWASELWGRSATSCCIKENSYRRKTHFLLSPRIDGFISTGIAKVSVVTVFPHLFLARWNILRVFFFANEQVAAPIAFVTSASALFLALFECASRFDNMILLASIFRALVFFFTF